jgi:glycosyltransferase involved in cell wall biosynthesis
MSLEPHNSSIFKKQVVFLFPLKYRPQKFDTAGQFALLSRWYGGHIFALSGRRQRNIPVADFFFHSEKVVSGAVNRFFRGLWIQVIVPLRLSWGRSRVCVVIAYDPYRSGVAALMLKCVLRCKMIVEMNGDYHRAELSGRNDISHVVKRFIFGLTLHVADAVKVLNVDQETFCRRHLPRTAIYRFPAFVATEYFESLESYQGNYLLSVGYPFDLKGMDVLIAAFRQISEKHPQIGLRIMGYCPPGELARYQALAGGHSRIIFIASGWIEDVGEQMRACYALVNASRTEAMGRVHVEAMACGKPVIATRTNGALECIEDGVTGLLCAIGDATDLAAKLDELLSSPHRAAQMGNAGKMRMKKIFSEEKCAEAYHAMIEEVAGRSTHSDCGRPSDS